MPKKTARKVAKKQANKQPSKAKPTNAKPKPDAGITLEQFRTEAADYIRADEQLKLFEKRVKALKPSVKAFVDQHAVEMDTGKSRGFVDEGVRWLLVPGRTNYDVDAGVAAMQSAVEKAKGDRRRILEACLVTRVVIDNDAWESAKKLGLIDDELRDAYERGRQHSLKWSYTEQTACPHCRAVLNQNARFCSGCGAPVSEVVA